MKNYFFIIVYLLSIESYATTTRLMLLGDSITYDDAYIDHPELGGSEPRPAALRHGYRNDLWYKLKNAQYNIDFVGSRIAGTAIIPTFDPDNEGYPGYTSYQISNLIYGKLVQNEPDIILLHIGSNDWSDSITGVKHILDEIDRYEQNYYHHIKVILARIINRRVPLEMRSQFNRNLQSLVESRILLGDDIVVVDMEHDAGLNYSDYQDRTHPNDVGYAKIANIWFQALDNIFKNQTSYAFLVPIYHIILH